MTAQGAHTGKGRGRGAARALGPEAGQAGTELRTRLAQEVGRSPREALLLKQRVTPQRKRGDKTEIGFLLMDTLKIRSSFPKEEDAR